MFNKKDLLTKSQDLTKNLNSAWIIIIINNNVSCFYLYRRWVIQRRRMLSLSVPDKPMQTELTSMHQLLQGSGVFELRVRRWSTRPPWKERSRDPTFRKVGHTVTVEANSDFSIQTSIAFPGCWNTLSQHLTDLWKQPSAHYRSVRPFVHPSELQRGAADPTTDVWFNALYFCHHKNKRSGFKFTFKNTQLQIQTKKMNKKVKLESLKSALIWTGRISSS